VYEGQKDSEWQTLEQRNASSCTTMYIIFRVLGKGFEG
jgi:hypothetical protein